MSRASRALTTLLLAAGVAFTAAGPADANVQRSLAEVRRATARYHDVNRALTDGYVSTPTCVPEMGVHARVDLEAQPRRHLHTLQPDVTCSG